jgi:hypothetical protein
MNVFKEYLQKPIIYLSISLLVVFSLYAWIKGQSGGDLFFLFLNIVFQLIFNVFIFVKNPIKENWKWLLLFFLIHLFIVFSIVFTLAPFEW